MPLPENVNVDPVESVEPVNENVEYPAWMSQAAGENKTNERLTEFKTINDMSNAYLRTVDELKILSEGKTFIPGENATDEETRAYLTAIGVPEDAESYKKVDSELPDGVGYTEEEAKSFNEMAFSSAWNEKQYAAFKEWEVNATNARISANEEKIKLQKEETHKLYQKEWGSDYDVNLNLMNKGVKLFGGEDFLTKLGPAGNLPEVINFLVEKGRSEKNDTLLDGELDNKVELIPGQIAYPSMKGM